MPASPMPDARRLLAATAAVALLFLLFLQPDAPGPFGLASLRRLPLELPAVVLLLLAFPSRAALLPSTGGFDKWLGRASLY